MKDNRLGAPASTGDWRALLAASASVIAVVSIAPAVAQDVEQVPEQIENEEVSGDEVVVTGSRIRRNEFTSSSPIQVINPEIGELQGQFDTAALVQSSSIAAGSAQITAAISSNFVTNGGSGTATVSLRGLGAERTLVLLNGRRAGPAGTRGAVNAFDLNVLPQSVIGSVEILKDGASSVYGSDAVAGVVNLITKRDTDGLEIDAFVSKPFNEGGEEFRGTLTWGKEFSRGHVQTSFDYYKRTELARGQRKYLDCGEEYIFDANTGERADVVDPRTGEFACRDLLWGHVWLYDYQYYYTSDGSTNLIASNGRLIRRMQYDYDGDNLGSLIPPLAPPSDPAQFVAPPGFFPVGYDRDSFAVENAHHPFYDQDTVIPETTRWTFYGDAAYQVTDDVEAYAEILINRRWTYQNGSRQFWQFGFTEDFLGLGPGVFGDPFAPGWSGAVLISPTPVTDHSDNRQTVDYLRALAGIRGDFKGVSWLESWTWDIYGQQSRNRGKYWSQQILDDSIATQDFRTSSCVGTVTPIGGRDCIDIDWTQPDFLAGIISDEERAFLFDEEEGLTKYTQTYVEGFFTGDLIDLPAGTAKLALGGTWRKDEINDTPGEITLANNAWGNTGAGITKGSSNTKEFFGEIDIPLLKDAPMVQSFDVQAAGRWTDVSTAGSATTYKVGLNWQVNDWLRFRGTYGTSFRAPALFELFLADQTSFLSQRLVDPCIQWGQNLTDGTITQELADNCAAQGVPPNHTGAGVTATIVTGGGLGVLEPETSKAKTLSVVLTPNQLFSDRTSLSLAVDYFNIEVNGEIAQLGAFNIVLGCLTSEFFPDDPLCDLFTRGQTGAPNNIAEVRDSFINVNSQKNTGIDVTADFKQELPRGLGDLNLLAQFTVQFKDTIALFEGTEVSNNGEDGEPKWVGDVNLLWEKGDWTFFYGLDLVGPTSDEGDYLEANSTLCPTDIIRGNYCLDLNAETTIYHSASVTKHFGDRVRLTAGVANLFDEHPPSVSTISGEITTLGRSSFQSNYDYVGRRAFLNVKALF
ncbi:MAG: TonB-dependent receptor [Amphiplicatus sp.]